MIMRLGFLLLVLSVGLHAIAAEKPANPLSNATPSKPLTAVLSPARWKEVESSVDRGLAWIASRQLPDGSFPTLAQGQPAVTSLCVMSLLSRGHLPGVGPYGQRINRAIDFVISCQKPDGLICLQSPGQTFEDKAASHTAVYNHAISGLMLAEVYGQVSAPRMKTAKQAIEKALGFSRQLQLRPKPPNEKGGWRYVRINSWGSGVDSDLSVTGWQLMFLRSARNAEFEVPEAYVAEATAYVRSLWEPRDGSFHYRTREDASEKPSRGMVGAGILSLSLAGQHQTPEALAAGNWLLAHPYAGFGDVISERDRFFYGAYYCSQAMAQLGGRHWERFFPQLVDAMLSNQAPDGSWKPEVGGPLGGEAIFGNVYTSALAVLSLTPPYQLLPVFQR